jgi:hypothetical protein
MEKPSLLWRQYFGKSTGLVQRQLRIPIRPATGQQILIQSIAEMQRSKISFATIRSQEEFFAILDAGVAANKIPPQLMMAFKDFYNNYKGERSISLSSGVRLAEERLSAPFQTLMAPVGRQAGS